MINFFFKKDKKETLVKTAFEAAHRRLHEGAGRNSDRDMPRSANRARFLENTMVGAQERRGNLFVLLCICHTDAIQVFLKPMLVHFGIDSDEFLFALKMCIGMESRFHDANEREEVLRAGPVVGETMSRIHRIFKRTKGQGWCLQKYHGLIKMLEYMLRFGSGKGFFGGPPESSHKVFVKDTGNNTQKRVDCFTS